MVSPCPTLTFEPPCEVQPFAVPSGGVTAGIADGATAAVRTAGLPSARREDELTWPTGGRACDVAAVLGAAMALPGFCMEAVLLVSFASDDAKGLLNGSSEAHRIGTAGRQPARKTSDEKQTSN